MNTPNLHVFSSVYPPKEDSFLLAESVIIKRGSAVLDMGCGSGIQGIIAFNKGAGSVTFVDINTKALTNVRKNLSETRIDKSLFIQSDLFEQVKGKFDVILFNPPYVPTEKIKWKDTDGGSEGREIIDVFLHVFPLYLKKNGKCFFLQSSLNGIKQTQTMLREHSFEHEIVGRKKLFFEELIVIACWKE
jgi:release factor glutamine methyltransferase